ncbi:MAG: PLP-dependent aminotransferase family protein [Deltaproteobacteria bacterium]|nr:PLP-dependent aminotransferase family protein [Deltaproteobacteria bacterium]
MDPRISDLAEQAQRLPGVIRLGGGLPANELLPRQELARALADVTAASPDALQYGEARGIAAIRSWIVRRLAARGAVVHPAHVIVTAGAQQALSIIGSMHQGWRIDVGDATYASAIDAFRQAGSNVVPVHGDVHYVIAGVSNPHGIDRVDRAALLATGDPLIVDEAYAELRFDGRVPVPLIADARDRVWHVGTISKTVCPGLRIGWLIPPPGAVTAALQRKQAMDLQTASVSQLAFARFLASFDYDAILERARGFYADRAARCLAALRKHLPGAEITEPEGGLSIWVETDDRGDDISLLETAMACGVTFDPGSSFRPVHHDRIAFRVSFSNVQPELFDTAARRLSRAFENWRRLPRREHPPVSAGAHRIAS